MIKKVRRFTEALFAILFVVSLIMVVPTIAASTESMEPVIPNTMVQLPMLFTENQGQLDTKVEYYAKASGQALYLTRENIVFDLVRYNRAEEADLTQRLVYSLDFLGANKSPVIEGRVEDEAIVNYLIGNDPEKWHSNIPTYREVVYKDIYPGIDLRLYGKQGVLEYEFVVEPWASVANIRLAYDGVDDIAIEDGGLVVSTTFGSMRQTQPYIYQEIGNCKAEVDGGFKLIDSNTYGFEVAAYDANYTLVIDPSLAYSTYLGGNDQDSGRSIAVESGYVYVTGFTSSTDFPTKTQYQTDQGGNDAFVAKIDATQSGSASLMYCTYLGGSGSDSGGGIAVESGCAYVIGQTDSTDFPCVNEYQTYPGDGYQNAFVTKLNTSGTDITYSTYLGGNSYDRGYGIAVESGYGYVTGFTSSTNFPTKTPYQSDQGLDDGFVAKIDPTQSGDDSLVYSTYLGGSANDWGQSIAVESGYAYVTGGTWSTNFPTTPATRYQGDQAESDAFVTKLNTTGDDIVYSTYLGGNTPVTYGYGRDYGYGIAVESGCAYVTGNTGSSDFPVRHEYMTNQPYRDAFVTKVDTTKSGDDSLIYSTYLGGDGSGGDHGQSIAVQSGFAYVTGYTDSTNFPTRDEYQTHQGGEDAFVTKIDTAQSGDTSLIYSTYLGGSGMDHGNGIAVESGRAYVTGGTESGDFPCVNQYQNDQPSSDTFVTVFGSPVVPHTLTLTANPIDIVADGTSTSQLTATVKDEYGNNVPDGTDVVFETDHGILGSSTITKQTTNGVAIAILTSESSDEPLIATMTATANGASDAAAVFFVPEGGPGVDESLTEKIIDSGTITDTPTGGDVSIVATGEHIITIAEYDGNPHDAPPAFFNVFRFYDVHLNDDTGVDSLTIEFCPANPTFEIRYWNGSSWAPASNQEFSGGCITVTVTADTYPCLADLSGLVFAFGEEVIEPPAVGGEVYPVNKFGLIVPWITLAVVTLAWGIYLVRRRAHSS